MGGAESPFTDRTMITDGRSIEAGATLTADLCIVGGGPAGIAMALSLADSGLRVCLLESGGLDLEPAAQALTAGDTSGVPYFDLTESRHRLLGGSTAVWGARSAPMTELDLASRAWVPLSGWPLTLEELAPYYKAYHRLVDLHEPFDYGEGVWEALGTDPPPFDRERLRFTAFQFGRILLLGRHYRRRLERASGLDVLLHANAVELCTGGRHTDRIERVEVRTLDGRAFRVSAATFVLACGGLENARLLLLSRAADRRGLCNDGDLVGRYFMEHPTVSAGDVLADDPQALCDVFSPGQIGGRLVETGLALSPAVQSARRCLNAVAAVRMVAPDDPTQLLRELVFGIRRGELPGDTGRRLRRIAGDPIGVAGNLWRHLAGRPKRFRIERLYLELRTEQEPDPDSRVTLSQTNDALGLPRAHLHWTLSERDRETMRVAAELVEAELRRLGLGRLERAAWLDAQPAFWPDDLVGGHHHMGTTRMSDDPARGVVDRDCRAHAVDNLYIAGSSVFPTAGYVNPTPTLVALALRLADHLAGRRRVPRAPASPESQAPAPRRPAVGASSE